MASLNGIKLNNAQMYDLDLANQTGVKTNKYTTYGVQCNDNFSLRNSFNDFVSEIDRQQFIERFKFYNLPTGITGELILRVLYYKGNGALFYMKENDTFYFLPYALAGRVDVYGRYLDITPVPFAGPMARVDKNGKEIPFIPGMTREPLYDFPYDVEGIQDKVCIILNDRSLGLNQTCTSRFALNRSIIHMMSECFPMLRTSLIASSGIKSVRVPDEDCKDNVKYMGAEIYQCAMEGNPYTAAVSNMEFQDLTTGSINTKPEAFLMTMQALDNFRMAGMGLKSGGLFQKKTQELNAEAAINDGLSELTYNDCLSHCQKFCDMYNYVFAEPMGLPFAYVEPNEIISGMDLNGDGYVGSQDDQSGVPGDQPEGTFEGGEE